jgi:glycosyltransferase involved in cell wall biosynthesis
MLLDNNFQSDHRVEKEARALIGAGYSVEVIGLTDPARPASERRNSIQITRLLDPLLYTRPFSANARNSAHNLIAMLDGKDFDFLHVHDYNLVHMGRKMKRARRALPTIYDSHEYFAEFPFYRTALDFKIRLKTFVVWRLLLLREQRSARGYDALVAASEYIAGKLSRRFRIPRSIALRNIPERQTPPSSNHLRDSLGLDGDSVVVVHSGNIYFPPDYLGAIHRSLLAVTGRAYFVMLVDESRSRRHRAFVAERGLADRIRFLDYPPKDKSIEYLSSASVGFSWVNPEFKSQIHTSANRYWEYAMAGLPVVSNHQAEIADEIRKFGNGLIYSEGGQGLTGALLNVLQDYRAFKEAATRASKSSSWESESQKLLRLYEELGREKGLTLNSSN